MSKILIFGNSGSGKSTLARHLSKTTDLAHLDLDTLAWQPTSPPKRTPLQESQLAIEKFIQSNKSWVIEGCYCDLLEMAKDDASEIIFMNLSIESCIANAKYRPWEPHKYKSKQAQDDNLEMLINWIKEYKNRNDTFSYSTHKTFYDNYNGKKSMIVTNEKHGE